MPLRLIGEAKDRFIDPRYKAIRDDRASITGIFIVGYKSTDHVRA